MNDDYKISIVTVVDGAGHLLMIRRVGDNGDPNQNKWEFPAGHVERGELTELAAVREVQEETGLKIYLMPWKIDVPTKAGKAAQFLGFVIGGEVKPTPTLRDDEHDRFKWVFAHNLEKMQPTHRNMREHLDELLHTVNTKLKRNSSHLGRTRKVSVDPDYPFQGTSHQDKKHREKSARVTKGDGSQVVCHEITVKSKGDRVEMRNNTRTSRSRRANEAIPTRLIHQLPGPGEDLREAILVGDEVEIFLKDQAQRGDRPAPDLNGIVDRRNRNTLWIKPLDEDDEKEKMGQSILWHNDGSWAFIRVYRDPDSVIHFVKGNPYDGDAKVVENAKGLGLILESDPPDKNESVWALMRGETPDLDRSFGQAPESFDNVAPFSKPRPGIPPILHRVREVLRNSGLEPDMVDHLGNGRVMILTSDSDLKKDIVRVLNKDGHEIKAARNGGLIVRDLRRRVAQGTTTIPIEEDDDLMRSTVVQRKKKLRHERDAAGAGGMALQNSQVPGETFNQGMVINFPPTEDLAKQITEQYGQMPLEKTPDGGVKVKPDAKQLQDMQKAAEQKLPGAPALSDFTPTSSRGAVRAKKIRSFGSAFREAMREGDYGSAGEFLRRLGGIGVSEDVLIRSRLASRASWRELYNYSVGAGEVEISRLSRRAARQAPSY